MRADMEDEEFATIQDRELRHFLLDLTRQMKEMSEVLDELTDRVLQLEEKQQDFVKSMNQRLNAIGERQEEG